MQKVRIQVGGQATKIDGISVSIERATNRQFVLKIATAAEPHGWTQTEGRGAFKVKDGHAIHAFRFIQVEKGVGDTPQAVFFGHSLGKLEDRKLVGKRKRRERKRFAGAHQIAEHDLQDANS